MNIYKLGFYNVLRRRNKAVLISLLSAVTICIFVIIFTLYFSSNKAVDIVSDRMGADIIILPNNADKDAKELMYSGSPVMGFMDKSVLDEIPKENISQYSAQFFLRTLTQYGCCTFPVSYRVLGIDYDSDFLVKPWLEKNHITSLGEKEVILGVNVMPDEEGSIEIMDQVFELAGTLMPTETALDDTIIMNINDSIWLADVFFDADAGDYFLKQKPEELISAVMIKVKDGADVEKVVMDIKKSKIDAQVISLGQQKMEVKETIKNVSEILMIFAGSTFLITLIALFGIFNVMASQREKEMGYLRAMGYKKSELTLMYTIEVLTIIVLGGVVGSLMGISLSGYMYEMVNKIVLMPQGAFTLEDRILPGLLGIMLSIVIGVLVSIIPVVKINKNEPKDVFTSGGVK
ncbi:ABC transporter permease [Acetoanaerobium noterae]|uniref:ABC transporter permease n=1 Tax=Acetoanaerobium noterae TaxID=745369 RepID=UPI0028AEFA16|nr:ABC transporter permease [Acetoanaerobium noterae]